MAERVSRASDAFRSMANRSRILREADEEEENFRLEQICNKAKMEHLGLVNHHFKQQVEVIDLNTLEIGHEITVVERSAKQKLGMLKELSHQVEVDSDLFSSSGAKTKALLQKKEAYETETQNMKEQLEVLKKEIISKRKEAEEKATLNQVRQTQREQEVQTFQEKVKQLKFERQSLDEELKGLEVSSSQQTATLVEMKEMLKDYQSRVKEAETSSKSLKQKLPQLISEKEHLNEINMQFKKLKQSFQLKVASKKEELLKENRKISNLQQYSAQWLLSLNPAEV